MIFRPWKNLIIILAMVLLCSFATYLLVACPFCSAINLTFAEQIKTNDVVVIAKLLEIPEPVEDPDAELPKSVFEITDVIKGGELVRAGMKIRSLLIGKYPIGDNFLVMGIDPPNVAWSTPMKASDRVVNYLQAIQSLPESGAKRLAFFQQYFEDEESVLAFDAYDEFAQAPYEDVVALKDQMNRPQLVKWIKDPDTSVNRRRLYLTMLGVCGQPDDIEMLEGFIRSGDRRQQGGLDALIACYLKLKGDAGLDLIVDTFLKDRNVEYVDTLGAVSALRFHGDEVDILSKPKVVEAVRTLLDRPKIADMVIPDLARWEDWSVMERLVQMFKDADEETSWLRVPIASYLRACPKPEAKKYIAELQKIDPDAIKRADFFLNFDEETSDDDQESKAAGEQDGLSQDAAPESNSEQVSPQQTARIADQITQKTYVSRRPPLLEDAAVDLVAGMVTGTQPAEANHGDTNSVSDNSPSLARNRPGGEDAVAAQDDVNLMPIAAVEVASVPVWQLILIPMACSIVIFCLLWSVITGWFDRLIY